MKKIVEDFKEVLHEGMKENFEKDGSLTPILFFIKDNQPAISQIPNEFLSSLEGKQQLANVIKRICTLPNVSCGGMIIEAYGSKIDKDLNPETTEAIMTGKKRISELDEKDDIIMMIFSTPEKDEMISYVVDCQNNTVGEPYIDGVKGIGGTFSNFFNWSKN